MIQWQRLGREDSIAVIEAVKSADTPGLMSVATCQVERAWLPFYKGVYLYRVTNFASLPSFTFDYLGDGKFFQYLDGTAEPIYAINDRAQMHLNEVHVLDYLEFFFKHVADPEDGEIVMLRNPHDMPLLDSLDDAAFEATIRGFQPPRAARAENGGFEVSSDFFIDGTAVHATIQVGAKGRVKMGTRKMSLSGLEKSPQSGEAVL